MLNQSRLILAGLITRVLLDTGLQLFYAFLPIIADGLDTSPGRLGQLIALRSGMGLLAPVLGRLGDLRGHVLAMRLSLVLASAGYLIVAFGSTLPIVAVGMALAGVGTFSFTPMLHAFLSTRLPYSKRARGLGAIEYSWALSGIFGLFLAGQLIESASWRTPLIVLGLALASTPVLFASREQFQTAAGFVPESDTRPLSASVRLGSDPRSTWATIAVAGLLMFGAMNLFVTYGTLLRWDYGVAPADLGTIALCLGLADLVGSVSVSLFGDRIGKWRVLLASSCLSVAVYLALGLAEPHLPTALLLLLTARLAFECSAVSAIVVTSDQAPEQRGIVMTLAAGAAVIGSSGAALLGPWLFTQHGLTPLMLASALAGSLAVALIAGAVRESRSAIAGAGLAR